MQRRFVVWVKVSFTMVGLAALALISISFLHLLTEPLQTYLSYLVAGCFWGSLLLEVCAVGRCARYRKYMLKSCNGRYEDYGMTPGIISFGKNKEGFIADVTLLISTLWVAVLLVLQEYSVWVVMPSILFVFLSFQLHCLLNGRNYRYMKTIYNEKQGRR